jgi:predicted outer membrane repeat protein
MSARSMKRARQRQVAKEQRRSERLGRRSKAAIGAGAALGATVLFAPSAQAESFTVTKLDDDGTDGTLRNELADAAADPGFDIVNFQPGLTGTILLNGEQLILDEDTEVRGPGRDVITVSGNDQSRVFYMNTDSPSRPSVISGLTITGGNSGVLPGGGIFVQDSVLRLEDVAITGNTTTDEGGGIAGKYVGLEIVDSTISGNSAGDEQNTGDGGGIYLYDSEGDYGPLLIENTTISGNSATGDGGGIYFETLYIGGRIKDSTISGNTADDSGGGVYLYDLDDYAQLNFENTGISGNTAGDDGGGAYLGGEDTVDGSILFLDSTVSGNTAGAETPEPNEGDGGGIMLGNMDEEGQFKIEGSTISGNTADDDGGGVVFYDSRGTIRVNRTTISGNTATDDGGGAYLYDVAYDRPGGLYYGPINEGSAHFNDSTIASNSAAEGGGIFNFEDDVLLRNTIVADNTNGDLAEAAVVNSQTFLLDFSLIENVAPSADTEDKTEGSNIIGQDPQLGPLADNGGPTQTHAPAFTSPVVDQGSSNALVDQRYFLRPFDQPDRAQPNLPGADASDIGAVELQAAPPQPQGSCNGEAATVVLAPEGETTFGTDGRDVIVGNGDQNAIRGKGGNDLICGFGGRDLLGGGPGNDEILGQAGNDNMIGDQNNDTMRGGAGNDKVSGTTGNDRMFGNAGRDRLTGAAGNDRASGGPQDDVLIGGSGADDLRGGAGKDRLNGGKGLDQLAGGAGRDQEIQQRR